MIAHKSNVDSKFGRAGQSKEGRREAITISKFVSHNNILNSIYKLLYFCRDNHCVLYYVYLHAVAYGLLICNAWNLYYIILHCHI